MQRTSDDAERAAGLLMWLLLAGDGVFIAVHLWAAGARPDYRLLSIEADNGYPELFQYLKFFWLALLLALLTWRRCAVGYLSWSALFAYLLLDDLLRLHEDGGAALAEAWQLPALLGLRAKDLGELLVSAAAALVLLPAIALSVCRGDALLRALSRRLVVLLVLLVFAGVGLDLLATGLRPAGLGRLLLGTLEDGGEMVIASVMLAVAFGSSLAPSPPGAPAIGASLSAAPPSTPG